MFGKRKKKLDCFIEKTEKRLEELERRLNAVETEKKPKDEGVTVTQIVDEWLNGGTGGGK